MSRLLTDSWEQEQHAGLKRWERGAQRAAWAKRSAERAALPLPCPWRGAPSDPLVYHAAHVLAMFAADLMVVRFLNVPGAAAEDPSAAPGLDRAGVRVVRGGVPWERWGTLILSAWRDGAPVSDPFRPLRRVPPQWLEQALAASPADQAAFIDRLRAAGFLSQLKTITPEAVASWLRWDEMRARLIDARED